MRRMPKLFIMAFALTVMPLWAAPKPAHKAAPKLTTIRFVTDWKAQPEHGGYYEALAMGLYAKRGLDVKILQGGASVNVPQLLAGGAADFGIGSNAFIPLNMVRAGLPVKAVMAVFQKDPQVLLTHPRGDIKTLADMRGKPIMISNASISTFWPWLRAKYGFSDKQIRKYTFNLAPFLVDKNAIQEGYLTSEPYTIERMGHFKPKIFLLADYGYPGYANMVLVPDRWIAKNPKAVQAFVDATRDGWYYYLRGNPAPANALIKRANPDMTDALIAQAIAKMNAYHLVFGRNNLGVGAMQQSRWKVFFDAMAKIGLYPKNLAYKKAFDTHFIDNAPQNFE